MARKKTGVSAKDRSVKVPKDVDISSANSAPKPRHRNKTKTLSSRSQQTSSPKLRMASHDTSEINHRPIKRQKSDADAGTTLSFDSIAPSKHGSPDARASARRQETDDSATVTASKEEHDVITGGEHEQKHDSSAENKYEGLRTDTAASTMHQSSGAIQDSNLSSSIPPALDPEAQHLQDTYKITFMSVISSSQVGQKTGNLLSAVQPKVEEDGTKGLAGLVVARAKGHVISKLVTIVERFMRATNEDGNTYYVYCSLKGVKQDKKSKPSKGGKTLRGWKQEDIATGPTTSEDTRKKTANDDDQYASQDTDEPAFEEMGHRQTMEREQSPKKIHVVPHMTMYISRVPLPSLKAFSMFVILPRKKSVNQLTSHPGSRLMLSLELRVDPEHREEHMS